MSYMNKNQSKISRENAPIPMKSKEEIASYWAQKAEESGGTQLYRADGSAIVGAITSSTSTYGTKLPRSKRGNHCKLDCCSERRPLVGSPPGLAPRTSLFPDRPEPEFTGWIRVEPRSVRRLKTRARFQKENEVVHIRPSVLYAMED